MRVRFGMVPGFVLAGLLAFASNGAAAPGHRLEKEDKSTVAAAGKTSISIKNARGRTVVVGRSDAKQVTIVAVRVAVGRDEAEAKEMLEKISAQISERGDDIVVETRDDNSRKDEGWSFFQAVKGLRRATWVDYTVEVPFDFDVSAATTSGEVRISNLGGDAEVAATSGDVSLRGVGGAATARMTSGDLEVVDVGGDLEVAATSGSVTIDNVKGLLKVDGTSGDFRASRIGKDAEIHLVSGDLVLDGCTGNVVFRASSGDAILSEIEGDVEASSSSGDIEVSIVPAGERTFRFVSSSGDIDVICLPAKGYGFQLDVRTSSGTIDCDLPIKVTRVDRRRLQGTVAAGTALVEIETASGDVGILEQSEAANRTDR